MLTAQRTRVLLVEDDAMVRGLVSRHLTRKGYEVAEAPDAEEALRRMPQEASYDLVLADMHLPGKSGVDLARAMKGSRAMPPVVFVTGDTDEKLARTALDEGAAGYLLKPFEFFELDSVLSQALRVSPQTIPTVHHRNDLQARDLTDAIALQRFQRAVRAPERVVLRESAPVKKPARDGMRAAATVVGCLLFSWAVGIAVSPKPEAAAEEVAAPVTGTNTVMVPYMVETAPR